MIAKAGIQIHLKSPGCKLLYSGIERDMYIMNFEISHVNRIADLGRGGSRGSEGGSVEKRLNIRKQPSFSRNLSCTLNHDQYASLIFNHWLVI